MMDKRFQLRTFETSNFVRCYEAFKDALNHGSLHLIVGLPGTGRTTAAENFAKENDHVTLVHCCHARKGILLYKICKAIIPDFDWPMLRSVNYGYVQRLRTHLLDPECKTRLVILDDFMLREWIDIIEIIQELNNIIHKGKIGFVVITTPEEYDYEYVRSNLFKDKFLRLLYTSGKTRLMLSPLCLKQPSIPEIKAIAKLKGLVDVKPLIGVRTMKELKLKLKQLCEEPAIEETNIENQNSHA